MKKPKRKTYLNDDGKLDENGEGEGYMRKRTKAVDKNSATKAVKRVRSHKSEPWIDDKVTEVTQVTANPEDKIMPVKDFPMDIFPQQFQDFAVNVATSVNVDPGLIASIALTILSSAVGNTVKIRAKPKYEVVPFLWLVVIAKSGEGKTPAIDALLDYVNTLQWRAAQEYRRAGKETKNRRSDKLTLERYVSNNISVASLFDIFEQNQRGIILHVDEVSRLILGFDNVSRGLYLELFKGGSWTIDRKYSQRVIPRTGAGILGGIQPKLLPDVFRERSFHDGLFSRFLLYPTSRRYDKVDTTEISDENNAYWERLVDRCYKKVHFRWDEDGLMIPRVLRLHKEARDLWESFRDTRNSEIPFLPERAQPFMSKLIDYYLLKFAGLLHVIRMFSKAEILGFTIDKETMKHAISLTNFFAGQVTMMLTSYDKETSSFDEFQIRLIVTLKDLEGQVTSGKLKLEIISHSFNGKLPDKLKRDPVQISAMLRKLNLKTTPGTNNYKYLIWEPERIGELFSKLPVTAVTSVTQNSRQQDDEGTRKTKHVVIPVQKRPIVARKRLPRTNQEEE